MIAAFEIDPLSDPRWDALVNSHPFGGVFHSNGWLRALHETYGYRPLVITTSPANAPLSNGVVLCEIRSFLTGRRLVSLPFSDHCDPLVNSSEEFVHISELLSARLQSERLGYVEFRPFLFGSTPGGSNGGKEGDRFAIHTLQLDSPLEQLFRNSHKDCFQRKVRRAEREGLGYAEGRSDILVNHFYKLMLRTRRRHTLPPQPLEWFQNLVRFMGDHLLIRVAYYKDQAIAATLSLMFKQTVTYKYSCSDERYANLGGTTFLIWKSIEHASASGLKVLDLGRSDTANEGLIRFKDHVGSECRLLQYLRISQETGRNSKRPAWLQSVVRKTFAHIPDSLLVASGKLLYRHMG